MDSSAPTKSCPTWKFLQMRRRSSATTWRMGIHSWYARIAAALRSEKHAPDALNSHPAGRVSLESELPPFQVLSATSWSSLRVGCSDT